MGKRRNHRVLEEFGQRLRAFRVAAELSQEQVQYAIGVGQSNITKMERGKLDTGLSQLALLADFFGVEVHELLSFNAPVPNADKIRTNAMQYLAEHGVAPTQFKRKLSTILESKLLQGKFLTSPRYASEIAKYIREKYEAEFTTAHISQALEALRRRGLVEKIPTDKKTKYQYRKL